MSEEKESWHLDKKVPVSLIAVVLFQLVAWVWVAADMNSRIAHLEELDMENRKVNRIVYGMQADITNIKGSLVRIEEAVTRENGSHNTGR